MEVEEQPDIQDALDQQASLYNELMNSFYSPLQYALEGQNAQALQNLRDQWTSGNPPEQDRFAMEIQSLRDISDQVANENLASGVTQLESMHEEITRDLQPVGQPNEQMMNIANGGRRKKRRSTKKKRAQRRKSKKLIRKRPCPV